MLSKMGEITKHELKEEIRDYIKDKHLDFSNFGMSSISKKQFIDYYMYDLCRFVRGEDEDREDFISLFDELNNMIKIDRITIKLKGSYRSLINNNYMDYYSVEF